MKTAILYLSKHGTTEKVARIIGDKLEEKDTELINLEKVQPSLDQYDRIIIGGSVYAGTVNKKLTSYCIENETLLAQKQLGLFVWNPTQINSRPSWRRPSPNRFKVKQKLPDLWVANLFLKK